MDVSRKTVTVAGPVVGEEAAKDSLSQLFARVLSQLALSAWLPAGALVLILAFVYELAGHTYLGYPDAIIEALRRLSTIQFGGIVLIVIAIAVSTMLSQAFAFGSIRRLEGYWGPSKPGTRLADMARARQDHVRRGVVNAYMGAQEAAWKQVQEALDAPSNDRRLRQITVGMREKLRERVMGTFAVRKITPGQQEFISHFDWEELVNSRTLHLLRSSESKLRDFPQMPSHIMPTRLGNILRRAEDRVGETDIEHFVERVFDRLPLSLQLSHDHQRSRLDLYCSMVFVIWFAFIPAALAFGLSWQAWVVCGLIAVATSWVCYLAALASARHYGATLEAIADHVHEN